MSIDASGTITTVASPIDPTVGPVSQALLADPRAIALTPDAMLFAGGASGTVQQLTATSLSMPRPLCSSARPARSRGFSRTRPSGWSKKNLLKNDAPDGLVFVTESTATPPDTGDTVLAITGVAGDPDQSTIAPVGNVSGVGPATTSPFRAPTGLYYDADARSTSPTPATT